MDLIVNENKTFFGYNNRMKKTNFSFLGRQPIFSIDGALEAYSILYRSNNEHAVKMASSREAYAKNMDALINSIGINTVLEDKKGWIKINGQTLIKNDLALLSKNRMILELTDRANFSVKLSKIMEELIEEGFSFAISHHLIDEVLEKRDETFFGLVDYVVFNVRKMNFTTFSNHELLFKRHGTKLLATNVETLEGYDICKRLGFTYFRGCFFEKPTILKGNKISTSRSVFLQIVAKIQEDASINNLANVISVSPEVSILLLKFINAADFSTKEEVNSISRAVNLLGKDKLLSWASLMLFSAQDTKYSHMLLDSSLLRAKLMEEFCILLKRSKLQKEGYLVGLLSLSDTIFKVPMQSIVDDVPLSEDISLALLHGEGELGKILKIVLIIEKGNFRQIELIASKLTIPLDTITGILSSAFAYLETIKAMQKIG